jgi:hypothetical protein
MSIIDKVFAFYASPNVANDAVVAAIAALIAHFPLN